MELASCGGNVVDSPVGDKVPRRVLKAVPRKRVHDKGAAVNKENMPTVPVVGLTTMEESQSLIPFGSSTPSSRGSKRKTVSPVSPVSPVDPELIFFDGEEGLGTPVSVHSDLSSRRCSSGSEYEPTPKAGRLDRRALAVGSIPSHILPGLLRRYAGRKEAQYSETGLFKDAKFCPNPTEEQLKNRDAWWVKIAVEAPKDPERPRDVRKEWVGFACEDGPTQIHRGHIYSVVHAWSSDMSDAELENLLKAVTPERRDNYRKEVKAYRDPLVHHGMRSETSTDFMAWDGNYQLEIAEVNLKKYDEKLARMVTPNGGWPQKKEPFKSGLSPLAETFSPRVLRRRPDKPVPMPRFPSS